MISCYVLVHLDMKLTISNFDSGSLGDSTFLILRSSKVIHAQKAQTHYFNAPRQLSKLPRGTSSDGSFMDLPSNADLFETKLQCVLLLLFPLCSSPLLTWLLLNRHGDILIVATDGFSDNVWPVELEKLVSLVLADAVEEKVSEAVMIQKLAHACCTFARICSFKVCPSFFKLERD